MRHPSQITRRTLLKRAAAAGAGVMALPQLVPSGVFGADAPSKKLNIGLLACGGRARDDMRDCVGSENIVAICDVCAAWPTRPWFSRITASCWTRSRSTRW
jgi:hypothetical protein